MRKSLFIYLFIYLLINIFYNWCFSLLFYSQSGKILDLIDLPGHEKLRTRFLEQYKDQARSVAPVAKDREP